MTSEDKTQASTTKTPPSSSGSDLKLSPEAMQRIREKFKNPKMREIANRIAREKIKELEAKKASRSATPSTNPLKKT